MKPLPSSWIALSIATLVASRTPLLVQDQPSLELDSKTVEPFKAYYGPPSFRARMDREKWRSVGKEWIKQDGLLYEYVYNPEFPDYNLRTTKPTLCDPSVQQYSGYLDIAEDKHLFFWFFESRSSPEDAPLILWLNGGPGGSSSIGLLMELGPCNIAEGGLNTTFNPYSWNNNANIIFLDQPVNVGYSYADNGTTVSTSPVAGEDVYAFLQLFLGRFKKYATLPFHIAAESYGGTYGPNIASVIHQKNQDLRTTPKTHHVPSRNSRLHINLESLVLGNGLTNPYLQFGSMADYACSGPYLIYPPNSPKCDALRNKIAECQRLIEDCYTDNADSTCGKALGYCMENIFGSLMPDIGVNPYDVRQKCKWDPEQTGDPCTKEWDWAEHWLNLSFTKVALGVDPSRPFSLASEAVYEAFTAHGDGARNSALLLPKLIDDGVRLLVYAGNADLMCNYIGNERWIDALETSFSDEFKAAKPLFWIVEESGYVAGEVRSAGGDGFTAGNVTFVNVYEAGHTVPYNQPEAALDLITRWIANVPLSPLHA